MVFKKKEKKAREKQLVGKINSLFRIIGLVPLDPYHYKVKS